MGSYNDLLRQINSPKVKKIKKVEKKQGETNLFEARAIKLRKKVKIGEIVYPSLKDAAKKTGYHRSWISARIKENKDVGGMSAEYYKEREKESDEC